MIVKAPAMKMYIYTYQYDKIKAEGYKSLAALPRDENFSGRLKVHAHSAGTEDTAGERIFKILHDAGRVFRPR